MSSFFHKFVPRLLDPLNLTGMAPSPAGPTPPPQWDGTEENLGVSNSAGMINPEPTIHHSLANSSARGGLQEASGQLAPRGFLGDMIPWRKPGWSYVQGRGPVWDDGETAGRASPWKGANRI